MKSATALKLDYGNWVSKRFILVPAILCLVFLGLAFLVPFMAILAVLFLLIFGYFLYARFLFSPAGKDIQSQIVSLIMDHLEWDGQGQILDIGCGNAPLTIRLAEKFPASKVTGIDYWGRNWDYSKQFCEQNAKIAGVEARTTFQKASASALPFDDGSFDLVVSNLTFHEVGNTQDKREVLQEALRVVRSGGRFVFQDLFLLEAIYGKPDELLALVKSWDIRKVEFFRTCDESFIPALLKLPFMVGRIGILSGEK